METNKRVYQKHKTEYKITVKYYLNRNVSISHKDADRHPVYLQITYQRKTTQVKSKYTRFLSEPEFDTLTYSLPTHMQDEIEQVKTVIERVTKEGQDFDLKQFTKEYNRSNRELTEIIDSRLKEAIVSCLQASTMADRKRMGLDLSTSNDESPIIRAINWELKAKEILSVFTPLVAGLKKIKPEFSSSIWLFDNYYGIVSRKFDRVYTWLDYQSGTFQRDLLSTYESLPNKQVAINTLLGDITQLLET